MALDDVSLDIHPGELLAVVGENGAGKSSLMNVLYGLYHPDSGQVRFDGAPVRLRSPADAMARGVGMVHQHFMLVPALTVAENVVLGREPTRRGLLDVDAACAQVEETCRRFGFRLDVRARVESLGVGSQQKVEIVRALHRGARTLVLDEPTAVLTPQEADELYQVARQLALEGRTVVFISHKLREVLAVATRIAVMRRGRLVAERQAGQTSAEELASLMVGPGPAARLAAAPASAPASSPAPSSPAPSAPPSGDVLQVAGVWAHEGPRALLRDVSLRVAPGEIVGIAGVDGNGQRELAEVLTGLRAPSSGAVRVAGREVARFEPASLRALGVGHVPEDRLARAVVRPMTVEENVALGRQREAPFVRGGGLIDFAGRRARTAHLVQAWDVRPPEPGLAVAGLSGGNQQKVVVARELDVRPRLLVAVQPTRGLDVGAVATVHARLREHAATGAAVLLVSLDLDEVLALSDRVYVMAEGAVVGERARAAADPLELGRLMLGAQRG